jgi:membrane associated rhomboid family serine protease
MGLYDREYYKEKGRGYLETLLPESRACKWLLGLHGAVLALQFFTNAPGGSVVTQALALSPEKVMAGEVWRLLTFWLMPDAALHWLPLILFFSYLWIFGSEVEQIYGGKEFLLYYVAAALVTGWCALGATWITGRSGEVTAGAGGAISAVVFLLAWHFPGRQLHLFMILPVSIWFFAALPILVEALQVWRGAAAVSMLTMVLVGAAFATSYFKGQWRLSAYWSLPAARRPRARSPVRIYDEPNDEEDAVGVAVPSHPQMDEHFEAKVDAVLDKVARQGQASLTEGERQVLLRASEIYRRKRT